MRILIRAAQTPFDNYNAFDTILNDYIWGNVGNLLFSNSLYRNLLCDDTDMVNIGKPPMPSEADYINSNYDLLLLPFANAFRGGYMPSIRKWTKLIKNLKIPCVIAGIGLQCGLDYDSNTKFSFDDDVIAFCSAIAEKSAFIGVRGERTYDYLKRLGFGNVTKIIGCPSLYTFGSSLPTPRKDPKITKLAVNAKITDKKEIKKYLL